MATLQNIGKLKYRGKDGQWHPLPVVVQDANGGVSTISGKGAPTSTTQGKVNQLYRDESTDKLYICTGDDGSYTWAAVVSDTEDAVTYTVQTLTNAQKAQARTNIGAGTSNFSGSYNDLTNKPNIPAASVIDTTLSKAGQAADAKTVGDALANKADTTAVSSALTSKANVATVDAALAEVDAALANKANKTEIPNVPSWAMASRKPTYTASEVGALPNTTAIPDVSGKLDKAQGTENAGKILGVGTDGIVTPVDKPVYTLPIATPAVLGGVKPVEKTTAMTQDVGVSADGKLYTSPSGGGTDKSLGITSATVGQIAKITTVDTQGKPTGWEAFGWETIADIIVEDENIYYYKWDVNNKNEFIMMVSLTPLTNSDKKINGIAGLNAAGTPWNQDAIRITGNIQSVKSTETGNTYIISGKKTDNKWTPGCFMRSSNAGAAHTTLVVGGSWYTTATNNQNPLSFPEIGEITNIAVGSYTKFFGVGSHIQIIAR